jgi:hypothetical protein
MTATRTLYRKANVSAAEATTSIFKRFPNVELVSFTKKEANAEEAKAARAQEGDLIYEATIRLAEFPPEGGDDKGGEDSGSSEPKEEKSEAPKEDSGSDSDSDDDSGSDDGGDKGGDEFGGGDGPEHGAEPKKLSPEEQVVHLLTQILDALKGGGMGHGPKPPHGGPEMGGDLPDIGAPGAGDELPPPPGGPHGGPGGPGAGAPLPPPVKEKAPIGAGAFAHVTGRTEVTMVRDDAGEIGNKGIIAEAATYAPDHRVARIQRTGIAQIGDDLIDLAEANKALVTLVSK